MSPLGTSDVFQRLLTTLEARYPKSARSFDFKSRLSPLLFCTDVVELPNQLRTQAGEIVRAFSELRENKSRDTTLSALSPRVVDPGNYSALMSYDFHVDSNGQLRLIEINTNASMSLMTELLYETQGVENVFSREFRREIIESFENERRLAGSEKSRSVAIVDEKPEEQRLYAEFILYKELFESVGFTVRIADPSELSFREGQLEVTGQAIDMVYNRHTDFYFETDSCRALREAMMARAACISPHPHEYRLLADKERLMELSEEGALASLAQVTREVISKALIRTISVRSIPDHAQLWSERKKWFFKPARSFGGKAAYRGSSISHPMFANILAGDYLAQEFVPAPSIKLPSQPDEFKYDLRFFVYRDRIQLACARLYRGQMTNSQTPGGGIAPIRWI